MKSSILNVFKTQEQVNSVLHSNLTAQAIYNFHYTEIF